MFVAGVNEIPHMFASDLRRLIMREAKSAFKKKLSLRCRREMIVTFVMLLLCCTLVACGSGEESNRNFDEVTRISNCASRYFLLLGDNGTISLNTYKKQRNQ